MISRKKYRETVIFFCNCKLLTQKGLAIISKFSSDRSRFISMSKATKQLHCLPHVGVMNNGAKDFYFFARKITVKLRFLFLSLISFYANSLFLGVFIALQVRNVKSKSNLQCFIKCHSLFACCRKFALQLLS